MKPLFEGYYDPTDAEIRSLWTSALIVLDTNVLLNLYRVSPSARREIMGLLESQKDRLWIPYQVAVEFQRNRLKAMRDEHEKAKTLATSVNKAYSTFRQSIQTFEFGERGSGEEVEAIMKKIAESVGKLAKLAGGLADGYVSPGGEDEINSFLTKLLGGHVGERPKDQQALDNCYLEAAERYEVKMGPGYLDQAKAGDRYMADGLIYDRQYGDYLLWTQLLDHVAKEDPKPKGVLLITSDVKEDWWQDTKTAAGLRPQPELIMDIRRRAGIQSFWMYTLSDFVKKSKMFLDSTVSDDTISDVAQADSNSALYKAMRSGGGVEHGLPKSMRAHFGAAIPSIAHALEAESFTRISDELAVVRTLVSGPYQGRRYAVMDVTARSKNLREFEALQDFVDAAVDALAKYDVLVLFDAIQPQEFWWTQKWGRLFARMVARDVPFLVEISGATLVDGSVVFTELLNERNNVGTS